ncbi:MAG: hypothetical protein VB859_15345 [Planctomycetaceae bacterium]
MRHKPPACQQGDQRRRQIDSLADRIRQVERLRQRGDGVPGRESEDGGRLVSTDSVVLDSIFPEGGLRRGTLVEWLAGSGPGAGAVTLALLAARCLVKQRGGLVVIDQRRVFNPVAAAALGIDVDRTLVVRPREGTEWLWTVEQVLRNRAVGVVLTWADHLEAVAFRRWQLAAETSGVVGMLARPCRAVAEPAWASVRLLVTAAGAGERKKCGCASRCGPPEREGRRRRWTVRVLRGRRWYETPDGHQAKERTRGLGGEVSLELNDETGRLHLLPGLVHTTPVDVSLAG